MATFKGTETKNVRRSIRRIGTLSKRDRLTEGGPFLINCCPGRPRSSAAEALNHLTASKNKVVNGDKWSIIGLVALLPAHSGRKAQSKNLYTRRDRRIWQRQSANLSVHGSKLP